MIESVFYAGNVDHSNTPNPIHSAGQLDVHLAVVFPLFGKRSNRRLLVVEGEGAVVR